MKRALTFLLPVALLASCATPRIQTTPDSTQTPQFTPDHMIMDDGYRLPLSSWSTQSATRAIVLALHGFNDYRNAFKGLAPTLAANGIQVYAYDQRGFGETEQRGIWPGDDRLRRDALLASRLICHRHSGVPLFIIGESMGGAVAMTMLEASGAGCVEGVVLIAPAVWGWRNMPIWQQSALWLAAHTWPAKKLTGEGLDIMASDNIEMLRAQGRDPLVIKETRIDSMFGLAGLMETASLSSTQLPVASLILYGERDEIIPAEPVCEMLSALSAAQVDNRRLVLYQKGFHMLTRDLQARVVIDDIVAWLDDRGAALPSGEETSYDDPRISALCGNP